MTKPPFLTSASAAACDTMRTAPSLVRLTRVVAVDGSTPAFAAGGRKVVYSTDSEHKEGADQPDSPFVAFIRHADLLVFDEDSGRQVDYNLTGGLEAVLARALYYAPSHTIRGGTKEILRGIVAKGLGLR